MSIELSMEYSDDFYEAEVKDVKEFEDLVDSGKVAVQSSYKTTSLP